MQFTEPIDRPGARTRTLFCTTRWQHRNTKALSHREENKRVTAAVSQLFLAQWGVSCRKNPVCELLLEQTQVLSHPEQLKD